MVVYGYVLLCMACLWLCRLVYGYAVLFMAMDCFVGLCMDVYGYVHLCMAM